MAKITRDPDSYIKIRVHTEDFARKCTLYLMVHDAKTHDVTGYGAVHWRPLPPNSITPDEAGISIRYDEIKTLVDDFLGKGLCDADRAILLRIDNAVEALGLDILAMQTRFNAHTKP